MNTLMTRNGFLDDFFKDVAPGFFVKPLHGDPLPTAAQMKVEVKETGDAYTVDAEVPGVRKEDIHVHIDGNIVSLSAEVKQEDSKTEGEKVLRSERYYGSVARTFQLPVDIDNERSRARYENGVLQLTLPKKKSTPGQRLAVE